MEIIRKEYDVQGNLIKARWSDGAISKFDDQGNIIKDIWPNSNVYEYKYDENGNHVKTICPNEVIYEYKHDKHGDCIESSMIRTASSRKSTRFNKTLS